MSFKGNTSDAWKRLQSLMMQLRKCSNHPFLFPDTGSDSLDPQAILADIIQSSGKMQTLHRMLLKLQKAGHRCVIFSQFTAFMDILGDYLRLAGFRFLRLDGSTNRVKRSVDIEQFNQKDSPFFVYLMSTRAGGLGINAQTADTVILMDSDWNPQPDLQAMARVHRIGQTKLVHVYRLVSTGTVEERIVKRAEKKLFLDTMVNRGGTNWSGRHDKMSNSELLSSLTFGFDRIFQKSQANEGLSDADIDAIIDRTRTTDVANNTAQAEGRREGSAKGLLTGAQKTLAAFDEMEQFGSIRTLQGKLIANYQKTKLKDIASQWAEEVAKSKGGRKRTQRLEIVQGQAVLKSNLYSLKEGEGSMLAAIALTKTSGAARQIAGRDYEHMDVCQVCWDGGKIICCDLCPASYHMECLDLTDEDVDKRFVCPQHSCKECGRKAGAVGGMLFRCEMCQYAFCEDHVPTEVGYKYIVNECKRYQMLGQISPSTACFFHCSLFCHKLALDTNGGMKISLSLDLDAIHEEVYGSNSDTRHGRKPAGKRSRASKDGRSQRSGNVEDGNTEDGESTEDEGPAVTAITSSTDGSSVDKEEVVEDGAMNSEMESSARLEYLNSVGQLADDWERLQITPGLPNNAVSLCRSYIHSGVLLGTAKLNCMMHDFTVKLVTQFF